MRDEGRHDYVAEGEVLAIKEEDDEDSDTISVDLEDHDLDA